MTTQLIAEVVDLRQQLAAVTTDRDQAYRLVEELGRMAKERIAELKRVNHALAERCAGQAELLANRAMKEVCV